MFTNDFGSGCHMSSTSSGLSMKFLFGSTDGNTICFGPLIRMGRSWMSWSRNGGTRQPQPGSFVGFSSNNARRSDS